jgi:hypothetical protein
LKGVRFFLATELPNTVYPCPMPRACAEPPCCARPAPWLQLARCPSPRIDMALSSKSRTAPRPSGPPRSARPDRTAC